MISNRYFHTGTTFRLGTSFSVARCASQRFPIPPWPIFCHDLIWWTRIGSGILLQWEHIPGGIKALYGPEKRGEKKEKWYLNYCMVPYEDALVCRWRVCDGSSLLLPLWVIFSLVLPYLQSCPLLSGTLNALESDSWMNTNRPSVWACSCPQNGILHVSPCPSPFLTQRPMWLHSHIWGFEGISS